MDNVVPPAQAWRLDSTDLKVWNLGQTGSGPAYALIAPSGWVRLALPAPADDVTPVDWSEARARLDDALDDIPTPDDGWMIATVLESEREVVEFGPLAPAPDGLATQGPRPQATVWSVHAEDNLVGWLIADLDSLDATLVLPWAYSSDPAWRAAARQVALDQLNRLPGRARWRLRIVAEEVVDSGDLDAQAEPLPAVAPAPLPPTSAEAPATRRSGALALGVSNATNRFPVVGILLALGLCLLLALALNQLRQRATSAEVPALSAPNVTLVPPRANADGIVTANRLVPLRREPDSQAPTILLVAEGQTMRITEGPRSVGGVNWWRVTVGNQSGWLPETLPDGVKVLSGRQ